MRNHYLLPVLALALTMLGCTKTHHVAQFPAGEIRQSHAIEFEFEDSIAPADSVGFWTNTAYLQIEPHIEGSFKWIRRDLLCFLPKSGEWPATSQFVATPTPAMTFGAEERVSPERFEFHTPPLKLNYKDLSWRETNYSWEDDITPIELALEFNYQVAPDSLQKYLQVQFQGAPVSKLSLNEYSPAYRLTANIDLGQPVSGPVQIEITLRKGLRCLASDQPLQQDLIVRDTLRPQQFLEINDIREYFESGVNFVGLQANQGLAPAAIQPYIALEPNMPFQLVKESGDIRILADFRPNGKYQVTLREGMPGMAGGQLTKTQQHWVTFPKLKPFIKFADEKGHYLMRNGYENLNVKATGVSYVKVKLYEIYENNLLHFIRANPSDFHSYSYYDSESEYYYDDRWGYLTIDEFGALIHQDSIPVTAAAQEGIVDVSIPLQKQFRNKFRGIFAIQIENDEEDHWFEDYKIVCLSDMGIIAKWDDKDLLVFVNRLSTATPATGASVSVISSTNQAYLTGTADAQGVVRFPDVGQRWSDRTFVPSMVTATMGSDLQFLDLHRSEVDAYRFDLEGREQEDYLVFAYGDRNLYRPGDTAYFSAIIRDWKMKTPKGLPVRAELSGPETGIMQEAQLVTNDAGSIEIAYPIPATARTGNYEVVLHTGPNQHYSSYDFEVEEFVPDKIKVQVNGGHQKAQPGDTLLFPVEAAYYFGAPCDNHKWEAKYKLAYSSIWSNAFLGYDFMDENFSNDYEWAEDAGTLDSTGHDTLSYIVPKDLSMPGVLHGTVSVTVWDNTGNTVRNGKSFEVYSRPHYLGFKEHGRYFNLDENFTLDYVAITPDDKPAKGLKMELKLIRLNWRNALRKDDNGFYYVSEGDAQAIRTDTIIHGPTAMHYSLPLREAGTYELTITMLDGSGSKRIQFHAYGRNAATISSFQVSREGTVDIHFDKKEYKVGENARILLTAPFSGRMLLTMERDKVYDYRYVNLQNNSAEVVVPVTAAFAPNMFVSATLFRPHSGKPLPLTVAHGYAMLRADDPGRHIPIKINAPDRIKPGRKQRITVQTRPGAKLTVAIVDEGVLAIRKYATPDAYAYMYEPRSLQVRGYDMYRFLLPEVPRMGMPTGGDGGGEWVSFPHLNPIRSKRFRPFAWWSGIRTAQGGTISLDIPIPEDFSGRARIMVMSYDGDKFGHAEQGITIRNDIVVTAAIPRFLTEGDSLFMPVNLISLTDKPAKATVKLSLVGPLKSPTQTTQSISLSPLGTATSTFAIKAEKAGAATIVLEVDGIEKQKQSVDIAVRPANPIERIGGGGTLVAGQSATLRIPAGFAPEFQQTMVTISPFPVLEFAEEMQYLLRYPHGCLEQTVSAAFPQLYFAEVAELIAPDLYNGSNAVHHVREALAKLEGMQHYNGGFSYWAGQYDREIDWATVYATHFLVEARKAGYNVREATLDRALSHLDELVDNANTFKYAVLRNGALVIEEKVSKELIYALYVLALGDRPDLALMNHYKASQSQLTLDARYMLAASYAITGDLRSFEQTLPAPSEMEDPKRQSGGSFDSPIRSKAIILNALAQADPTHPRIASCLSYIRMNRTQMYSTQDKAWLFLALGKLARNAKDHPLQATLSMDGKQILQYSGSNARHIATDLAGKSLSISATGKGNAWYYWQHTGTRPASAGPLPAYAKGMSIERQWYDTDGKPITHPVFNVGELVVCKLRIKSKQKVENIAISDEVPAGFEVENTRLSHEDYGWIQSDISAYDNADIRDDRMNVYASIPSEGVFEYNYLIRAVNQGVFRQPPVIAEAMYDPSICARAGGGWVKIFAQGATLPQRTPPSNKSTTTNKGSQPEAAYQTPWQRFLSKNRP